MPRSSRRAVATLLALVVAGLVLLGCSGSDDDESSASASDASDEGGAGRGAVAGEAEEPADGGGAGTPLAARSLIRTAELSLVVEDVDEASSAAVDAATAAGGFQSGGQVVLTDPPSGFVVLRVPNDRFQDVLATVRTLGDVADQRVQVDDVSEQVVDLDSRIVAATASVERVRGFLEQTSSVGELAGIEAELTAREGQLEALLGQRRAVEERVDLATITARFGVEAAPALVVDPEPSDSIPGFVRALRYGWVVLVTVFQVVAAIVGFLLPFAVIGVPAYVGGRRIVQRRRTPVSI